MTRRHGYRVYGVRLCSDRRFRLPLWRDPGAAELALRRLTEERPEPPAATAVYTSPRRTAGGDSVARLYRVAGAEVLRFAGGASFWLGGDQIDYQVPTAVARRDLELYFLGAVMAYWLERRGCLALHASAVEVEGRAVAFLSPHGGGKTALAASLVAAGNRLVTDDLLAVDVGGTRAIARPGLPVMRMWPRLAERFVDRADALERLQPGLDKRLVPVGVGFGSFQPHRLPLAAIYLPRRSGRTTAARIAPATGSRALKELVRCSWSPYIVEAVGLQAGRLERLSRLVERVPMRVLEHRSGLARLGGVARAVLADLARH